MVCCAHPCFHHSRIWIISICTFALHGIVGLRVCTSVRLLLALGDPGSVLAFYRSAAFCSVLKRSAAALGILGSACECLGLVWRRCTLGTRECLENMEKSIGDYLAPRHYDIKPFSRNVSVAPLVCSCLPGCKTMHWWRDSNPRPLN